MQTAARICIVGGDTLPPTRAEGVRESPPWGGPAMPALLAASAGLPDAIDGVLAVDGSGRRQPLLAVYRTSALRLAVAGLPSPENLSVRRHRHPGGCRRSGHRDSSALAG